MDYLPAESDSGMFGGNSNWRGPVWMPVNVLIIRALLKFYLYYGDNFKIECPTGSGKMMNLFEVRKRSRAGSRGYSCAMSTAGGRFTGHARSFSPILTGAITFCSTSTSTVTTVRDSARAIRPDGPVSWPGPSSFTAFSIPGNSWT